MFCKVPLFVRWLSFERRASIALWLREKATWAAEWICPELKDQTPELETEEGKD